MEQCGQSECWFELVFNTNAWGWFFLGIVQVSKGQKSLHLHKNLNYFLIKNDKYIQSHACEWLITKHAFMANTCMCFRSFYFYLFIMEIKLKKINFISIQISWNGAHCCFYTLQISGRNCIKLYVNHECRSQ